MHELRHEQQKISCLYRNSCISFLEGGFSRIKVLKFIGYIFREDKTNEETNGTFIKYSTSLQTVDTVLYCCSNPISEFDTASWFNNVYKSGGYKRRI